MRSSRLDRVLLGCGAVGPPLFVVVFLVEGATRAGYSALRHPVSSLALGDLGWVQRANFLVTGALLLAFAAGLRSAPRRDGGGVAVAVLAGLVAVGLIGAGLFATDPIGGYPAGTPAVVAATTDGTLHNDFSLAVFLALPVACLVLAYRFATSGRGGWACYCAVTAVAFLTGFVLSGMGFSQDPTFVPIGGLLQRLTIVVGWAWLTALAVHLLRTSSAPGRNVAERAGAGRA